ncbi:MAG: hypothetical protein LUD15_10000 [Bacteroides sp.]|nr:hypothetical protein [Bacteroides sp.]
MNDSKKLSGICQEMALLGIKVPSDKVFIKIPDAENVLDNAMRYFLGLEGKAYVKLPEYKEIAEWLTDNQDRGLFLYGNCGRGKTLLGRYVLPAILLKYCRKIVNCFDLPELDRNIDQALKLHLLSIDDISNETVSVYYGKRRMAFPEIIDTVEKYGKLVIITSNLTVKDLTERYGDRVLDRIKSTCKLVVFEGESPRE